jgi:UDP:flavonoid glycosyltransferase YjiC (YdhE family)
VVELTIGDVERASTLDTMEGRQAASPGSSSDTDVLVVVGPGLGHYHPIAPMLLELAEPSRIALVVTVPNPHPLRERIQEDGFRVVDLGNTATVGRADRALRMASRWTSRRLATAVARRGRAGAAMPPSASRLLFALASNITPLAGTRAGAIAVLDRLVAEHAPRLLLGDDHPELGYLATRHGLPWATYTTGPVSRLDRGHPVSPAGFAPQPGGPERLANALIATVTRVRRRRAGRLLERCFPDVAEPAAPLARFAFGAPSIDAYPGFGPHTHEYVGTSYYRLTGPVVRGSDEPDTILVAPGTAAGANPLERSLLYELLPVLVELADEYEVVVQSNDDTVRATVDGARFDSRLRAVAPTPAPLYDVYRRLRLTIGHGGYGTINESVAFGAPILTVPELRGDRMETAQRVQSSGVGATTNRYAATTESLRRTIRDLLEDTSVMTNVERASRELRDRSVRSSVVRRLQAVLEVH